MAWSIYPPAPGTQYGPCIGECEHKDCAQSRYDATKVCRICGQVIGWEAKVMFEGEDKREYGIVHAVCAWREEDERQEAIRK